MHRTDRKDLQSTNQSIPGPVRSGQCNIRLQSERFQVSGIHATLLQADALQELGENAVDRLLFWPDFQPFLHMPSATRKLGELHDLSPICRWNDADDR